jgi:hypothetical protein
MKDRAANPLMMKPMRKSSRKKWTDSKKVVAKKTVDRVSAPKFMDSLIKNPLSSHRSSRRALRPRNKSGSYLSNRSFSKT